MKKLVLTLHLDCKLRILSLQLGSAGLSHGDLADRCLLLLILALYRLLGGLLLLRVRRLEIFNLVLLVGQLSNV